MHVSVGLKIGDRLPQTNSNIAYTSCSYVICFLFHPFTFFHVSIRNTLLGQNLPFISLLFLTSHWLCSYLWSTQRAAHEGQNHRECQDLNAARTLQPWPNPRTRPCRGAGWSQELRLWLIWLWSTLYFLFYWSSLHYGFIVGASGSICNVGQWFKFYFVIISWSTFKSHFFFFFLGFYLLKLFFLFFGASGKLFGVGCFLEVYIESCFMVACDLAIGGYWNRSIKKENIFIWFNFYHFICFSSSQN